MTIRFPVLALFVATLTACAAPSASREHDAAFAGILRLEDTRSIGDAELEGYLAAGSPAPVRVRAALAAGRIGAPVATPSLLDRAVTDEDADLRRMAVFALGEMDDPAATPALIRALGDPDPAVRSLAAEALGKIKAAEAAGAILERVEDQEEEVAGMALLALWKIEPGETLARRVEAASRVLAAATGELRRRAAYFLMRSLMGTPEDAALEDALADSAGDRDPLIRSFVARGLGASRTPRSTALLIRLAGDPDWRVRVNAYNGLRTRPVEGPWDVYAKGLEDTDHGVRLSALAALESCRAAEAEGALAGALGDDRPRFREVAALAIARRDGEASLPALRRLAADPAWSVRARAAEAICAAGGPIEHDVARLTGDADPRVRSAAVAAAGATGTAWAREMMARALADDDLFVRAAAIDALGSAWAKAGNPEALVATLAQAYRRGIGDAHSDARLAALGALAAVGLPGAADEIEEAIDDRDYLVRRRAADLLALDFGRSLSAPIAGPPASRDEDGYMEAVRRSRRRVTATLDTEAGRIVLELFPADAPLTVDNFLRLAREGRLDGLVFHRVVPNFVIQDGDPRGDGNGGPPWQIRCEINTRRYGEGAVGMALSGKDTGGSQYFITHSPQPHLDGGYTVFGQVVSGQEAVDAMVQGDRIRSVTVEEDEPR